MLQSHQPAALPTAGTFSRRELLIWVAGILAAHDLLTFRGPAGAGFFGALTQSVVSTSAFHYLAWFAVFRLLADADVSRPSTRGDVALGLAAALLPFLRGQGYLWIAIPVVGIYFYRAVDGSRETRAAAIVLLALAVNGFWGRLIFDVFAPPLLQADAALIGALLSVTRSGYTWHGTIVSSADHSIIIVNGCSSFHSISLGLLCWLALTKLARPEWVRGDVGAAVAVCVTALLLNLLRVYLLALSAESYAYWHAGFGAQLFVWTSSAAIVGVALWGVLRAPSPT
jgi:exosortase/archaeosortase family protein